MDLEEVAPPSCTIRAVLFDLDGTLIASVGALRLAYAQFVEERGAVSSDEEFESLNGVPLATIVSELKRVHSLAPELPDLYRDYVALLDRYYVERAELYDGAARTLGHLARHGLRIGVVTSAPEAIARRILERVGVLEQLSVLVCGDNVTHGKPAPDPYARAVSLLQLGAEAVLAVEDSFHGVTSAVSANLRCVGLRDDSLRDAGAFTVIESLYDLGTVLDAFKTVPLGAARASRFTLAEVPPPRLDPETESLTRRIWTALERVKPGLYDGPVVVLGSWECRDGEVRVEHAVGAYRHCAAARRGVPTGVRGVAVTGVTFFREGTSKRLVLGRRSTAVIQSPGAWEFIPSGALDAAHRHQPTEQLLSELESELGIAPSSVVAVEPLGAIDDENSQVFDLCYSIEVQRTPHLEIPASDEYSEVLIVSEEEAASFLQRNAELMVPTCATLLKWVCAP